MHCNNCKNKDINCYKCGSHWEYHEPLDFKPKKGISFPAKTHEFMIQRAYLKQDIEIYNKLQMITSFWGPHALEKKNRWFGYCQGVGEERGLWSLDEIIKMVRSEINEGEKNIAGMG